MQEGDATFGRKGGVCKDKAVAAACDATAIGGSARTMLEHAQQTHEGEEAQRRARWMPTQERGSRESTPRGQSQSTHAAESDEHGRAVVAVVAVDGLVARAL